MGSTRGRGAQGGERKNRFFEASDAPRLSSNETIRKLAKSATTLALPHQILMAPAQQIATRAILSTVAAGSRTPATPAASVHSVRTGSTRSILGSSLTAVVASFSP